MKKFLFLCATYLLGATVVEAQELNDNYRLKTIIPVAGRQGIAADEDFYYVSSSTGLFKYKKTGELVLENIEPFTGLELEVNHFGDIDVWNGEIFTGIEFFIDGVGKNIQIGVYDAATLQYKYAIPFDASSGQVEVSGITVDRGRNEVWMSDWVNGEWLYRYDLKTKKYIDKLHLRPAPQRVQGIYYVDGKLLISADDGDADFNETDNIYIVDANDHNKTTAYITLFKEMKDFKRAGEIEGLSIDPENDDLLVLTNRGSRIILGMVKGFYPGYEREISEVYVYEKVE